MYNQIPFVCILSPKRNYYLYIWYIFRQPKVRKTMKNGRFAGMIPKAQDLNAAFSVADVSLYHIAIIALTFNRIYVKMYSFTESLLCSFLYKSLTPGHS